MGWGGVVMNELSIVLHKDLLMVTLGTQEPTSEWMDE